MSTAQLDEDLMQHTFAWRCDERVDHDYLLFKPRGYDDSNRDWPMLVYLHGGGGTAEGTTAALDPLRGEPYVILAPICPSEQPGREPFQHDWDMRILGALIDSVCDAHRVDESRVSLMGFSMGGSGAWLLPYFEQDRFCRVAVVSGACHPWMIKHYPPIPVWSFSGSDEEFRPQHTHSVVSARQFGVDITHTIWHDAGHGQCFHNTVRYPPLQAWLRGELERPIQPDEFVIDS